MDESVISGMDAARAKPETARSLAAGAIGLPSCPGTLTADGLAAILDELPYGVFVVDVDGSLRFANEAGRLQLAARDGLQLRRGILGTSSAADMPRLRELVRSSIAGAASLRGRLRRGPALALERSRGRPLLVVAKALRPSAAGEVPVLLFVSDPDREPPPSAELLGLLFGLSPAEVKLTLALLQGHGLQASARAAGISLGTAHTHLRHIFSKTGTSRQAELVRLVLATHVHASREAPRLAPPRRDMQ